MPDLFTVWPVWRRWCNSLWRGESWRPSSLEATSASMTGSFWVVLSLWGAMRWRVSDHVMLVGQLHQYICVTLFI